MELRTGPGGNQADIAARLRAALVEVATTVRQIQNEIDQLITRRQALEEGNARATQSGDESLAARAAAALAQIEERLADLRNQLVTATQARSQIEAQLAGFPELAIRAEADANSLAVRQMLAAAGIDDVDPDRADLDPLATELPKVGVDAELEAIRRELGLAPPPAPQPVEPPSSAPPPPGAPASPGHTPAEPTSADPAHTQATPSQAAPVHQGPDEPGTDPQLPVPSEAERPAQTPRAGPPRAQAPTADTSDATSEAEPPEPPKQSG